RQLSRAARGKDVGPVGLMAKLVSTNIGSEVAKLALALLGDEGLQDPMSEMGAELGLPGVWRSWVSQYMYSLGVATAGGTAHIQRNVIGAGAPGLPRAHPAGRGPRRR